MITRRCGRAKPRTRLRVSFFSRLSTTLRSERRCRQLALACDLRVLASDARFSMREAILGLVPDLTGTKHLVDLVGYSRALEICATTRWVDADEARDIGLATAVVPADEIDDAVDDLVAALTAPIYGAVTETKALIQSALRLDLDEQRLAEREAQVRRFRELASLMGE